MTIKVGPEQQGLGLGVVDGKVRLTVICEADLDADGMSRPVSWVDLTPRNALLAAWHLIRYALHAHRLRGHRA